MVSVFILPASFELSIETDTTRFFSPKNFGWSARPWQLMKCARFARSMSISVWVAGGASLRPLKLPNARFRLIRVEAVHTSAEMAKYDL